MVLAVIGPPAATHSERLSKLVPRRLVSGTDDAPDAGLPTGSDDQEVEPVPQAAQQRLR